MRKNEITFHGGHAAVNVKLHRWSAPDFAQVARYLGATEEQALAFAAQQEGAEVDQGDYDNALSQGWGQLEEIATEIFGKGAEVYSEGRSGGWARVEAPGWNFTVEGVRAWDAIEVSKWGRFSKRCAEVCADIPYFVASSAWGSFDCDYWKLEESRVFSFFYDAPPSFEVQA